MPIKNKPKSKFIICKTCSKKKKQTWGRRNCKDCETKRKLKDNEKRKKKNRKNLKKYLIENPCVDCGEMDIIVLQFDHVRGKKRANISQMVQGGYTWENIMSEIQLCEIVCGNCHLRRTAKQQGWSKSKGTK